MSLLVNRSDCADIADREGWAKAETPSTFRFRITAVSKLQLLSCSLVAAIPGGFLAYQLVQVFISHGGGPSTVYQGLVGLTLACAILLALTPVGVLAMYNDGYARPKAPRPPKADKGKAGKKDLGQSDVEIDEDEEDTEASGRQSGLHQVLADDDIADTVDNFQVDGDISSLDEDNSDLFADSLDEADTDELDARLKAKKKKR